MPVNVRVVEVKNNLPTKADLEELFQGAGWRALMDQIGKAMADQARRNMLAKGGPGGDWPQLSGFNVNKGTKAAREEAKKHRAAGMHKSQLVGKTAARHSGYAERKAAGKTPGKGKFGADIRLRDTGELFASLKGETTITPGLTTCELKADGGLSGRPTNQELLEYHSEGAGNLPVRNPAENMEQFEKAVQAILARYVKEWMERRRK